MSEATRIHWPVAIRLQGSRTRFGTSGDDGAPAFRVRGYDQQESCFALVGDTPQGRLAVWLDAPLLERFRAAVAALGSDGALLVEGKDELWRTHRLRVPLGDDDRGRIGPLLLADLAGDPAQTRTS